MARSRRARICGLHPSTNACSDLTSCGDESHDNNHNHKKNKHNPNHNHNHNPNNKNKHNHNRKCGSGRGMVPDARGRGAGVPQGRLSPEMQAQQVDMVGQDRGHRHLQPEGERHRRQAGHLEVEGYEAASSPRAALWRPARRHQVGLRV